MDGSAARALITTGGMAMLVATLVTPVAGAILRKAGVIDVPGSRSSHVTPTPRSAGVGMILAILIALFDLVAGFAWSWHLTVFAAAVAGVAGIGFLDDLRGISPWIRLAVHSAAAAAVVATGAVITGIDAPGRFLPFGIFGGAITAVWLIAMTNVFNFMDGINGIATLEAIVVASTIAVLLMQSGDEEGALLAAALAGAASGFLPWNFPHAAVFMGDVASGTIGFLLAFLAVRSASAGLFFAALLPMLPFLADALITLVRRALRRENVLTPHRSHFYQRLNQTGVRQSAVSTIWTSMALVGSVGAVRWMHSSPLARAWIVMAVVVLIGGVFCVVTYRESRLPSPRL